MSRRVLETSLRIYQALLWLYPAAFRRRYGREMLHVFRDSLESELNLGFRPTILAFWLRTLADVAVTVLRENGQALAGPAALGFHRARVLLLTLGIAASVQLAFWSYLGRILPSPHPPASPAPLPDPNLWPLVGTSLGFVLFAALHALANFLVLRAHRTRTLQGPRHPSKRTLSAPAIHD